MNRHLYTALLLLGSLSITGCGGGGGGGGGSETTPTQAKAANVPLTVLIRDGERIFDSVIDSYGPVNHFVGSRDILATLVNEQLAVYTGQSANTGMISEPTFVNELYGKMLELPSVQGVDENGNHIQLTSELLQQIQAGDVVITPVRSAEDIQTLNFTEFSTKRLSLYEQLVEAEADLSLPGRISLTDFVKDDLGIDINDTDGTVFGVVETVLEFREVLNGNGTYEEDIAAVQLRLDEMSTALVSLNEKLDALSITMREEFSDIQLGDLDEKLIVLKSKVALFNQASNNAERSSYATEVDFIYEELLNTLLNAIIKYDRRIKDTSNYSNNAKISFDLRVNAKYDFLTFTPEPGCKVTELFENYQHSLSAGGGHINYEGHLCSWLTQYMWYEGYQTDGGWVTNSYDTGSLILDVEGKGLNNEINIPIPAPISGDSYEIKDTNQYVFGYSKDLQVDFLNIFTSYIYARYLINPWVENIDSAESKNQAISESHLNMINMTVSQVGGDSLSLKENLLEIYRTMEKDHLFLFNDDALVEGVTGGHNLSVVNPAHVSALISTLRQNHGDINSAEINVVADSIGDHLAQDFTQISTVYGNASHSIPILNLANYVSGVTIEDIVDYDTFYVKYVTGTSFADDWLLTSPVKLFKDQEVICCVLEAGTPTYDAIDVYPSVRMRVGVDVWGAIDIGAVKSGTATKLAKLYMGAKTDKLLKSVARLATLEVILKTHCLGLNPTEERYEVCDIPSAAGIVVENGTGSGSIDATGSIN